VTSRKLLTLPDRQAEMRERYGANGLQTTTEIFTQRHYTSNELAKMWGVHPSTIRRIFEEQPGVLKLSASDSQTARRYVSLRIPESIAEAWYREHSF
jgi:hypothetical protein